MNRPLVLRTALVTIAAAAAGFVGWKALAPSPAAPTPSSEPEHADAPARPPTPGFGFDEVGEASGLHFRMAFLPDEQGARFKINLYDHGAGVAVADYDADGDDDVYLVNQLGPNGLFRNDGKGQFDDVTKTAGVGLDDRICVAATFADVDGDGDQDLYVTSTRGGNAFLRNRGDGTFADETKAAGLTLVAHSEQGTFFDADGDGDLDLLVTNTARWTTESFDPKGRYWVGGASMGDWLDSPIEKNVFYRNDGRGGFTDDSSASGLEGIGWSGDCAVLDFDDDGDRDVFIANMFGRSALYANDGKARFRDVTKTVLGRSSWGTVGIKVLDYDGDGRLDILCVDMHSDMWMDPVMAPRYARESEKFGSPLGPRSEASFGPDFAYFQKRDKMGYDGSILVFGNTLFRNLGGGRFEETSDRAGVETLWPWGVAAGDFDGDGHVDVYIPSGMGYPYGFQRSPLLMGGADGRFVEKTDEAGITIPPGGTTWTLKGASRKPSRSARSAATFDADGDGRLDLVVNRFNDRASLYKNRFKPAHWATFALTGTKSDRDAIGAVVRLTVGARTYVRQVDAAGGYLAQSSRTLHFGLADATKIDRCEVRWPSGRVETFENLEVDRLRRITEPKE